MLVWINIQHHMVVRSGVNSVLVILYMFEACYRIIFYAVSNTLQEGHVISDPEPVDLLAEHLRDKEANGASGIDNANPTSSGFLENDDESQVFKQAAQHSKPDRMQSVNDEL
jgi:hypothetical protein